MELNFVTFNYMQVQNYAYVSPEDFQHKISLFHYIH